MFRYFVPYTDLKAYGNEQSIPHHTPPLTLSLLLSPQPDMFFLNSIFKKVSDGWKSQMWLKISMNGYINNSSR